MKLFAPLLFTSLLHATSFNYLITKEKLEEEFSKKFPIEKRTLLTTIVLSEPQLSLKSSKIILHTTITLPRILDAEHQALSTRVKLKSDIDFVAPSDLYLKDIEIIDIENKYLDEEKKKLLRLSITIALNAYFKNRVAYTINNHDIKGELVNIATSHLQNITIKDEGVELLFEF